MTPRPRDEHLGRVEDIAYRAALAGLRALEASGVAYVLVGGWAVAAHGSRIPSVDTDVMLPRADRDRAIAAVDQAAPEAAVRGRLELLDMDGLNAILGPDLELGEPDLGYVPRELLQGRTARRTLALQQGSIEVTVPEAPELAFMKLKAYYDRELSWRALRDPQVMATIPTFDRPGVRSKTEGHFRVKAGKDLYDLAYLGSGPTNLGSVDSIASRFGLSARLMQPLRAVPWPLRDLAIDLAYEAPEAQAWIRRLPTV